MGRRRQPRRRWIWIVLVMVGSAWPVARADSSAAAIDSPASPTTQPAISVDRAALAPFITDNTVLVAEINPSALDFGALEQWVNRLTHVTTGANAQADNAWSSSLSSAESWFTAFKKAGGGRIYMVGYVGNPTDIPIVIVVPLGDASQAKAISSLLVNGTSQSAEGEGASSAAQSPLHLLPFLRGVPFKAIVLHQAVVVGSLDIVSRLPDDVPASRPDISAAMSAIDDSALVKVTVVPPFALKILANAAAPGALPDWLGGGPTEPLIMGLSWLDFSIHAPPGEAALVQGQFSSDDGAQAFAHMIISYLAASRSSSVLPDAETDAIVKSLTPAVQNSQVWVRWDARTMKEIVEPIFIHGMQIGHQQTLIDQSSSNVRQLLLGCMIWSNEHHGVWPTSLDQLAPLYPTKGLDAIIVDPARSGAEAHYVYVQPPVNARFSTMAIHESDNGKDQVIVGYVDGSTAVMNADDFRQVSHPATNPASLDASSAGPATQPAP